MFKTCLLGSKYAIWPDSEKLLWRHSGVANLPPIGSKNFSGVKIGLLGPKYVIWWDSEKSTSGGQRYPTVADRPPVPNDNTKSRSPCEPLLSPIVVDAWSRIWLGLVQMDICAGQTDRRVPNIIKMMEDAIWIFWLFFSCL